MEDYYSYYCGCSLRCNPEISPVTNNNKWSEDVFQRKTEIWPGLYAFGHSCNCYYICYHVNTTGYHTTKNADKCGARKSKTGNYDKKKMSVGCEIDFKLNAVVFEDNLFYFKNFNLMCWSVMVTWLIMSITRPNCALG